MNVASYNLYLVLLNNPYIDLPNIFFDIGFGDGSNFYEHCFRMVVTSMSTVSTSTKSMCSCKISLTSSSPLAQAKYVFCVT